MLKSKLNIVLLSASNPYINAGIMVYDMYKALSNDGHKVVIITKYYDIGFEQNIKSVYGYWSSFINKYKEKIVFKFNFTKSDPDYYMHGLNEINNYISTKKVLHKINFKPDLIVYIFPHRFLNVKNLYELQLKTNAHVCVYPADMAQFTGGCHYTNGCNGFKSECSNCPGLKATKKDITSKNLEFKSKYTEKTKLYTLTNTWTSNFITKSTIYKHKKNYLIDDVINEADYSPGDKDLSKSKFGIPSYKRIIFFGATAVQEKRKGFKFLVEALNLLYQESNNIDRSSIGIAIAGKNDMNLNSLFSFEVFALGHLPHNLLVDAFRIADVYVSPSIQDTGPMMVLQSLMCGTPVIAFEIGNAVDFIIDDITGYKIPICNTLKLKEGISKILKKSEQDKFIIGKNCREIAVRKASYKAFSEKFINNYDMYISS